MLYNYIYLYKPISITIEQKQIKLFGFNISSQSNNQIITYNNKKFLNVNIQFLSLKTDLIIFKYIYIHISTDKIFWNNILNITFDKKTLYKNWYCTAYILNKDGIICKFSYNKTIQNNTI